MSAPEELSDDQLRADARMRVREWDESVLHARLAELDAYERPTRAQRAERQVIDERIQWRQRMMAAAANPYATERVDNSRAGYGGQAPVPLADRDAAPWKVATPTLFGPQAISSARSLLDNRHRDGLPDAAAAMVERMLTGGRPEHRERAAQWMNVVGSPLYERVFWRMIADPQHAHLFFDDAERNILAAGRAMAEGTGSTGGFAVPVTLDPTVILTSDGTTNPIRQMARTVRITTKEWDGVSSEGVVSNWYDEAAEVSDDSPVLAQPKITTHRQSSFVPFSLELDGDWNSLQNELRRLLLDSADTLDAQAFATGTGTGQPKGVVTALDGTTSEVTTATAGLTLEDLEAAQAAVPPRFRGRAMWAANLALIQAARKFEIVTGQSAVSGTGPNGLRLLDDPLREASQLDGEITTTGGHVAVVGDWAGYVIVERVGATIELVPHLFGPNHRPTGQRGLFLWRRVGADVVNPNALRLLTIGP